MSPANLPNVTIIGPLSLLELIWLLVTLPGFIYSAGNYWDARLDMSALQNYGQGTIRDWLIARQRARHALAGACIEFLFVVFGVASAFTPNPTALSWLGYLLSLVFIAGSLLLTWSARRDQQDRRRIRLPHEDAPEAEQEKVSEQA